MKVLVLKAPKESQDDVDPYVSSLREEGMDAEELHALSFQYINQDLLRQKVLRPENFGGIIFTSPRSVVAVSLCIQDVGLFDNHKWSELPFYVVGEGTAKVLWEKLKVTGIGQESGSAQELAQFICKDVGRRNCRPLLFPSAELKRNILLDIVIKAGILVDTVTSYRTVPNPELGILLKEKFCGSDRKPDVLVFFSPSGVNAVLPHLLDMEINLENCMVIAIGPTTEQALQEHKVAVTSTAKKPSPAGLIEAIKVHKESTEKMPSETLN